MMNGGRASRASSLAASLLSNGHGRKIPRSGAPSDGLVDGNEVPSFPINDGALAVNFHIELELKSRGSCRDFEERKSFHRLECGGESLKILAGPVHCFAA